MSMPKISVIVPVYNVELYLEECVESIRNQTIRDIEIILVDDGSLDSSSVICDMYVRQDSRIKVIHQNNRGLSGARNSGIAIAAGEWIAFVDSDDIIEHSMYEKLLNAVCDNNTMISTCSMCYMTENGKFPIIMEKTVPNIEIINSHQMITERLWNSEYDCNLFTSVCNKLYRREIFEKYSFREGIIFEDDELATRLYLDDYKISIVNEPLYYWRMNEKSITHSKFSEKQCIMLDILIERVQCYKKHGYYKISQKTAKIFTEMYIEYWYKATAVGHPEWLDKYRADWCKMKKMLSKTKGIVTNKNCFRYTLFTISPILYAYVCRIK